MKKTGNQYIDPAAEIDMEPANTSSSKHTDDTGKPKKRARKPKAAASAKGGNQYNPEGETEPETETETAKRKFSLFKPVTDLFAPENRRLNLTLGSLLVLFSIYQLLSFISYFFT